jgi:hypothetical protein
MNGIPLFKAKQFTSLKQHFTSHSDSSPVLGNPNSHNCVLFVNNKIKRIMKKSLILVLGLALFTSSLFAQDFEAPKDGAKIYTESTTIEIDQKGEALFDLWIVRSNRAKWTTFQMPKISTVDGLEFYFKQDPENKDHYTVNVKASNAALGSYSGTVTCRSNGVHLVTGTILNLNVVQVASVASVDGK